MKTIIAGGRNYKLTPLDYTFLSITRSVLPITEVVSGCARGVDTAGEQWAFENGLSVMRMPAALGEYGKAAGPIRNSEMAQYADALVVFPGGRGTADMITKAVMEGLIVFRRQN